jgi:hypothetical protein
MGRYQQVCKILPGSAKSFSRNFSPATASIFRLRFHLGEAAKIQKTTQTASTASSSQRCAWNDRLSAANLLFRAAPVPVPKMKDAVGSAFDSSPLAGINVSRTCRGSCGHRSCFDKTLCDLLSDQRARVRATCVTPIWRGGEDRLIVFQRTSRRLASEGIFRLLP